MGASDVALLDLLDLSYLLSLPQHLLQLLLHELLREGIFGLRDSFQGEVIARGRLVMFVTVKAVLDVSRVDPEANTLLHCFFVDVVSRR